MANPGGRLPRWEPLLREFSSLRTLVPSSAVDLSPAAVERWPAYGGRECPRCGAFLGFDPPADAPPGDHCLPASHSFRAGRSLFAYAGDVRSAIVGAKYASRPFPVSAVAGRLLDALGNRWRDLIPDGECPTVVPVPATPWKYLRRGFNLPALIGACLSRRNGFPFDPLLLAGAGGRAPQAGLPGSSRRRNVEGAFRVPRGRSVPSAILLLDDVYTSGATVEACARALKSAGAASIVVVTVARTVA